MGSAPGSLVVALCAAWCETCRAFRPVFDRLAAARSDSLFLWLDVDEDTAVAGDIEIDGFPCLAVFRSGLPVFFGVAEPHERQLMRVLAAMAEGPPRPVAVPETVAMLPRMLAERIGKRGQDPFQHALSRAARRTSPGAARGSRRSRGS